VDQIRRTLANIQKHLGGLGASHRLLIGSLVVIVLMALFLVSQYAGRPAMVELIQGASAEDIARAREFLDTADIRYKMDGGVIKVPVESKRRAMAMLAQEDLLPADKTILFSNLSENMSWTDSKDLQSQKATYALQNELARVIADFDGVAKSSVFINVPQTVGLGQAVRKPTAAVTVFSDGGRGLDQKTVDAVAGFISGSVAGLTADSVRVIDGSSNQQRKATNADDLIPMTYLQQVTIVENQTREKLVGLLQHIPNVVVAVTAQVDVTRAKIIEDRVLAKGEGSEQFLRSEKSSEHLETGETGSAEPGPRSNQAADINRGGSGGSRLNTNESTTEYDPQVGRRTTETLDPRGMTTGLAVSVNVPRGYVVRLVEQEKAAGGAEGADGPAAPTEAEVEDAFIKKVAPSIEASIRPHVAMMTQATREAAPKIDELIKVSLIPVDDAPMSGGPGAGILGGSGGLGLALGGVRMVDTAILGGLAVVALGMMLSMVRRAGRKVELPTPEELVGIPPALKSPGDMVGEADEGDTAMAGIEVGDDQLKTSKMLEQVGRLVEEHPSDAAKLINRWVVVEE
jgi:flagellar biosynthesis/type III secretory pathway M-ring protein FliF/YscJ